MSRNRVLVIGGIILLAGVCIFIAISLIFLSTTDLSKNSTSNDTNSEPPTLGTVLEVQSAFYKHKIYDWRPATSLRQNEPLIVGRREDGLVELRLYGDPVTLAQQDILGRYW